MPAYDSALHWFRRDLRDDDNAGLYHALKSARRVHCAFVFDREILDKLENRADRRVEFIRASVVELQASLRAKGGDLVVLHDTARTAIPDLARRLGVDAVFANGDYEPDALARDSAVRKALGGDGKRMHLAKDQAIFEKDEVLTQAGKPYTVFTPYKNAWLAKVEPYYLEAYPVAAHARALSPAPAQTPVPSLEELGFENAGLGELGIAAGMSGARAALGDFAKRIARYAEARDFPAVKGVSCLSMHNRFGTVSIRELARLAAKRRGEGAKTWLSELIWRDFYFQILWHYPGVSESAFRTEYGDIDWPNDAALFAAWREARTGYPLVDAAMRQLNQTGYMHNRLRMVAASFLAKDLLVDWRLGERYFAAQLNDFDLAANNGGWQWAASTGCDAQPYFRIFNPTAQSKKFDPRGTFIRRYVPELARVPDEFIHEPSVMSAHEQQAAGCIVGRDYPAPVVDHATQRAKALSLYKRG